MAEISGVGGRPVPPGGAAERSAGQKGNVPASRPVTQDGQPVNLIPVPLPPPGQPANTPGTTTAPGKVIVPDVLTGRDTSQQVAGERLRTSGTPGSATDKLLGLDWRPTIVGAFPPPPGNAEALKHLSPAMRRAVFRSLLDKQREQLLKLNRLMERREGKKDEREEGRRNPDQSESDQREDLQSTNELYLEKVDVRQLARADKEVKQVFRMLETVERMLAMQDYTLSQMGTFSKG